MFAASVTIPLSMMGVNIHLFVTPMVTGVMQSVYFMHDSIHAALAGIQLVQQWRVIQGDRVTVLSRCRVRFQ